MTANASSSSVTSRPELKVDLAAAGLLAPLPSAWLAGRDLDLLEPLRFLPPGRMPEMAPPRVDRRELAAALGVSNRSYDNPNADALARKLADPATRVVVTGQQPGLFGGPLYCLAKAIAVSRWAAALEAAGEPAVALYWVANEDHDWVEVSSTVVLTAEGAREFNLGPDPEPLTPVGMRALGPAVDEILQAIGEAVPGDRMREWLATIARWYRPDTRIGDAFCRLIPHLLGAHSPLMLDAMHPALKEAQRPWLRRLVERRTELEDALAKRDDEVKARGYSLQVSPQRGLSPLFLLRHGERRRIEWRGEDGFVLRGRPGDPEGVDVLYETIEENPGVVTPGVLARPAIQDAVLGTTLQVLGPGELSYMAQASATHAVLEVEPPWVALRPQTLFLEAKLADRLVELELPLATLLGDKGGLERWLAERNGGDLVGPVKEKLQAALEDLRGAALGADPGLERPFEKTREQILRALDVFGEKAVSAAARKNEVAARRVQQLRDACLPLGKQQERILSSSYFPGKYGGDFVESYWNQMELDAAHLQVIVPGEGR